MIKLLSKLSFTLGMIMLYAIPKHKYGWVYDLDPSIPADAFVDSSSNSTIFTVLILLSIILFQVIAFVTTKDKKQKRIPILLAIIAIGFWFYKFSYRL